MPEATPVPRVRPAPAIHTRAPVALKAAPKIPEPSETPTIFVESKSSEIAIPPPEAIAQDQVAPAPDPIVVQPESAPQADSRAFGNEPSIPEKLDGNVLQAIRKARGLSIEQVSEKTHIPRASLSAIEANDFSSFAARVYLVGFVRQFAQFLGLDGERTARAYVRQLDQPSS
jgi:hypothetical protein